MAPLGIRIRQATGENERHFACAWRLMPTSCAHREHQTAGVFVRAGGLVRQPLSSLGAIGVEAGWGLVIMTISAFSGAIMSASALANTFSRKAFEYPADS